MVWVGGLGPGGWDSKGDPIGIQTHRAEKNTNLFGEHERNLTSIFFQMGWLCWWKTTKQISWKLYLWI